MKRVNLFISILVAELVWLAGCAPGPASRPDVTAAPAQTTPPEVIALPAPRLKGMLTLEETLAQRRSLRQFSDTPLTWEELGQLLWAAQGITHPAGLRTAPSAGALYPLEIYAVIPEGVYHYQPGEHQVTLQAQGDVRAELAAAALRQAPVAEAPAVLVIAAVYARTAQKYGPERSPRYVHLEAGHAAQNILLQAVALNLGAVPIGAFTDRQVQQVLALPLDQQPLYLVPVGRP